MQVRKTDSETVIPGNFSPLKGMFLKGNGGTLQKGNLLQVVEDRSRGVLTGANGEPFYHSQQKQWNNLGRKKNQTKNCLELCRWHCTGLTDICALYFSIQLKHPHAQHVQNQNSQGRMIEFVSRAWGFAPQKVIWPTLWYFWVGVQWMAFVGGHAWYVHVQMPLA